MASATRCDEIFKSLGIQMNNVPTPRAPPRLLHPNIPNHPQLPAVVEVEKPNVPDVSLILNSAATSFHSNAGSSDTGSPKTGLLSSFNDRSTSGSTTKRSPRSANNYFPTPPQSSNELQSPRVNSSRLGTSTMSISGSLGSVERERESDVELLKAGVNSILMIVKQQENSILKLSTQMEQLIAFQDKFLSHMLRKGGCVSKAVQTENLSISRNVAEECTTPVENVSGTFKKESQGRVQQKKSNGRMQISDASTTVESLTNKDIRKTHRKSGQESKTVVDSKIDDKTADLSNFLKNYQLSNIQEPTAISEGSFPSFNFPVDNNFNLSFPNVGNSISLYDSSSEDEDSPENNKGSTADGAEYYNDLLGTVNRMLEGGHSGNNSQSNLNQSSNVAQMKHARSVVQNSNKMSKRGTSSESSGSSTASYSGSSSTGERRMEPVSRTVDTQLRNRYNKPALDAHQAQDNSVQESHNVKEATRKYLESIGVQLESPVPPKNDIQQPSQARGAVSQQQQNYMIQQNVYNSIYIPAVNCVPVMPESLNSNSGMLDNLAHKYISPSDLREYGNMNGKVDNPVAGGTETTVYGMSSNNLSFATKEYLQRYGLTNQVIDTTKPHSEQVLPFSASAPAAPTFRAPMVDRILDITAIRNQPKLL